MNIETLFEARKPRHRVWLKAEELTAGTEEGTWVLANSTVQLGEGSELWVIDKPGTVLLWDAEEQCGTVWTGSMS